ncbi:hypothetical protein Nepgr_026038 [Nepenthes gracilis]|uniref:Uncharacterized protein n=1 Tax=Nepenthes gracilis TaxID=150966 RepID=A0AAD3Y1P4_NEPGR|nr:hypothetical protein Nepgr_026038 [Nepenthes gracilis]
MESAADGLKSAKSLTAYYGDDCLSSRQYCPEGLLPCSECPFFERTNKHDALDTVSGTKDPLELTLGKSEQTSSASLPVEPPLLLNDTVADSLCQSDAPVASPMGSLGPWLLRREQLEARELQWAVNNNADHGLGMPGSGLEGYL